jgi:hypothetical protein
MQVGILAEELDAMSVWLGTSNRAKGAIQTNLLDGTVVGEVRNVHRSTSDSASWKGLKGSEK